MITYSMVRYLLAKQPVDDRALNRQVLAELERALRQGGDNPRVLELGAGVGTMVSRLADWGVLARARYTLIDRDAESLDAAQRHLGGWGELSRSGPNQIQVQRPGAAFDVRFKQDDLYGFLDRADNRNAYELVIANAVLDLFDLESVLPRIWQVLAPGGLFWFTINFDGETLLLPELPLDQKIMQGYHASMSADAKGTRAGHPQTGRLLLTAIPKSGASLLAAGGSDWVVFPQSGAYSGDEAYFLHHIIEFIRGALAQRNDLSEAELAGWVEARHAQIERTELCYVAHQLDVFGKVP